MLFGDAAMERLARARVAVAGLGAVGSYAVEALARSGVGFLRLVDFDVIAPSNLNRQLFALESTLGRAKVEAAAARVADIHPACRVEALRLFVDADTAGRVIAPPLDAVVDAIDSLGPKVALLAAAVRAGVPVYSSMGAASRTDPSAIRVGDIAETAGCPLARLVRKRLRGLGLETGVRCVYSTERPPAGPPEADGEATETEAEDGGLSRGRQRRPIGSASFLTGMFGLHLARETLMRLIRSP